MASRDLEKTGNNRSADLYVETSDRTWTSWLIPMIVVANVIVFIIVMYINNCPDNNVGFDGKCVARFLRRFSFQPLIENPLFGPSSSTLLKMGGLQWNRVVYEHQGWRLLTAMWLHAGLFHLLVNMLCLVVIGIRLEQQFGFVKVGILYLLSGFGGSVLSALFLQMDISVGASGALFGMLGAMLSELLINWTLYSNKAATLFTLVVIIAINLAIGLLPRIDNFAHIGGFVVGFLLGFVVLIRPRLGWAVRYQLPEERRVRMRKYMPYQQALFVIALLLLIAGFAVSLVMLFRKENGNDHCSWCHYLDCVPTSRWRCDN
ncbi:hypothetical protein V2J09_000407 [Rumex salicifolius]